MIGPDQIDRWRVIPRVMVAGYGLMLWFVTSWFTGLDDPNMAQGTFVSTVYGAAALFFNFYVNSGPGFGTRE